KRMKICILSFFHQRNTILRSLIILFLLYNHNSRAQIIIEGSASRWAPVVELDFKNRTPKTTVPFDTPIQFVAQFPLEFNKVNYLFITKKCSDITNDEKQFLYER